MQSIGTIKRGDTFSFTASIVDVATNNPLTGVTQNLKCQGKYNVLDITPILTMTISETTTIGTYLFSAPSTDLLRPNSDIYFDIQYTNSSNIISSTETFYVHIESDVTR